MKVAARYYAEGPEPLLVSLAAGGDRLAFTELVRRKQSWIRSFMRRCSRNDSLADDLAQQVFMQAWRKIRNIRDPDKFGSWLKKVAVNEWMQNQRKSDPLWNAQDIADVPLASPDSTAAALDLDKALEALPGPVRLCVVLAYHERLSHREIAALTGIALGTVKSHVSRGSTRLRELLSAYGGNV